ncbi:hypothetical protein WLQ65_23830 [Pseudoalteromonas piscicida]|uniref:hypothetical protein n=1 Tax=Pseudoalteromonas piscicida TaxID=43662 RepID=UPI0030C93D7B
MLASSIFCGPVLNTVGLLELDVDPNATRIMVQDRLNGNIIYHGALLGEPMLKVLTPAKFSLDPALMVTIFDDGKNGAPPQFNAETVDRVQASLLGTGE